MKYSCCCIFASFAIPGYFLTIMSQGSIEMSYHGDLTNNATAYLNDATAKFNAANNAYETSKNMILDAEQTIVDANCFITQHPTFTANLNSYCRTASEPGNSLDILKSYGSEIISGFYGATFNGSNSEVKMDCGRYTHAISVEPFQDINYIRRGRTRRTNFTSGVDVSINVDSTDPTDVVTYNLDPETQNFSSAYDVVILMIAKQCEALKNNISTPTRYQNIIDRTYPILPELRSDAARKQELLNTTATYKNEKQEIYNNINAEFQHTLSIWLPQLFIALPCLILICSIIIPEDPDVDCFPYLDDKEPCCGITNCLPMYERYTAARAGRDRVERERIERERARQDLEQQQIELRSNFYIQPEILIAIPSVIEQSRVLEETPSSRDAPLASAQNIQIAEVYLEPDALQESGVIEITSQRQALTLS